MKNEDLRAFLFKTVKIADDIGIKYKQLKTMEQSGMANEMVYKSTCAELINLWNEEKKIYASEHFEKADFERLLGILCFEYKFDITSSIEDYLHNNKFFAGVSRVFFQIQDLYKKCQEGIVDILIRHGVNVGYNSNLKSQINNNWRFIDSIYTNFYWTVINFISKYLEIDNTYKDELIRTKYLILFLNNNLEEEFKNDNLEYRDKTYLNYNMIGDFIGMPREIQDVNIQNILFSKFSYEQVLLLNISDQNIEKRKFDVLLSEIIMRSALIFLDEIFIDARKKEFDEVIKKHFIHLIKNQEGIRRINKIYNCTKKDKSQYKYLSLKPR